MNSLTAATRSLLTASGSGQSAVGRATSALARSMRRGGDHHGHHYKGYNEPGGNFLGIPPAPPGYRRKKLFFEKYMWLYAASFTGFFICMYYRPDSELESWAREEALRRMKERGENWDTPGKPY